MNHFYKVVKLLRDILQADVLINTVIFARTEDKDLYKKKLYPLAHINPISSPYSNSTVREFVFEIGVFEQRDINSENTETYFEGNDDLIDNYNVCDAVLNRLISTLSLLNNEYGIELINVSNALPLVMKDTNLLDGFVVEITLQLPNNIDICYEQQ
jgi:hypothetical protein